MTIHSAYDGSAGRAGGPLRFPDRPMSRAPSENDSDANNIESNQWTEQLSRVTTAAHKMRGISTEQQQGRRLIQIRDPNPNHRTFYFKEESSNNNDDDAYFVKVYELETGDKTFITKSAKRLNRDFEKAQKRKERHPLSEYVLMPLDVQKAYLLNHKYEMEVYHFVECENFEERVQREIRRGSKERGLNPSYFINGRGPHSNEYILSVLPPLIQAVAIVIAMQNARWFDADIRYCG